MLLLVLLVPMIYYVIATNREAAQMTATKAPGEPPDAPARRQPRRAPRTAERRPTAPLLAQPVAAPVVPRGLHLAVPDLVAGADRDRGAVLVQQRPLAVHLAGLLLALVLQRPGQLGAAQPAAARRGHPDRPALGARHAHRGAARRRVRARHQPLARPGPGHVQLRDDLVLRDPRADLRRVDVLRLHHAVQHGAPGHPRRGARPGHLERQLARDRRPGPARHHRPPVRGGRRRPRRQPVPGDAPGACSRCSPRPSSPAPCWSSPA